MNFNKNENDNENSYHVNDISKMSIVVFVLDDDDDRGLLQGFEYFLFVQLLKYF